VKRLFPPINLFDCKLAHNLFTFLDTLAKTANASNIKVVILSSANPEYFLDHIDIHRFSRASREWYRQLNKIRKLHSKIAQIWPISFIAESLQFADILRIHGGQLSYMSFSVQVGSSTR
jgi:hypothetical protein